MLLTEHFNVLQQRNRHFILRHDGRLSDQLPVDKHVDLLLPDKMYPSLHTNVASSFTCQIVCVLCNLVYAPFCGGERCEQTPAKSIAKICWHKSTLQNDNSLHFTYCFTRPIDKKLTVTWFWSGYRYRTIIAKSYLTRLEAA